MQTTKTKCPDFENSLKIPFKIDIVLLAFIDEVPENSEVMADRSYPEYKNPEYSDRSKLVNVSN